MNYSTRKSIVRFAAGILASILIISAVVHDYNLKRMSSRTSLYQFTEVFNTYIESKMDEFDIPGVSIALIRSSSVLWQNAYGLADREGDIRMTPDTVCRVQSISKSVTALGIMKLVEEGILDLDASVNQYVSTISLPAQMKSVTLRQLLTHTSGLELGNVMDIYSPMESRPTLQENLEKEISIKGEAGVFSYSNVGFNLLELIIQEVTGRDFAEYMENEVLVPLGMENSTFEWNLNLNIPMGYGLRGKPVPPYVYPEKASGGLYATAGDIASFAIAGMHGPEAGAGIIKAESVLAMHEPNVKVRGLYGLAFDSYGLGYFLEESDSGVVSVSHGGQGTGIMTHMQYYPESGDGIVILTNSQRSWPFIASILKVWSDWSGLESPGMARILVARSILIFVICAGFFTVMVLLWQLAEGLAQKNRKLIRRSDGIGTALLCRLGFSVILAGIVVWNISKPYSNIASLFPRVSVWLWILILSAAMCILVYSIFPRKGGVM